MVAWEDVERQLKLVIDLVNGAQPEVRLSWLGHSVAATVKAQAPGSGVELSGSVRRVDESAAALQRAAREAVELAAAIAEYAAEYAARAERLKASAAAALNLGPGGA